MVAILFEERIQEYSNVHIFTNKQSSIQAIEPPKRQSEQYIIKSILDIIDKIYEIKSICSRPVHIEWVSGHKDIDGNEQADQAAKTIATSSTTLLNIIMKSAQNRTIQSMVKTKWEIEWKMGKENARRLRSMSQHPHIFKEFKLYETLERKHVILISRLRTGHCHLNQYLHRFNIVETSECECGVEKETVEHYLLNCELYDEERDVLRR